MGKAEDLKRTIDRLNDDLTRIESIPDPTLMPIETVLFWEKTYAVSARSFAALGEPTAYKYVAIKVLPNSWYTTSLREGTQVYTDDELRDVLAGQFVSERYIVSEWLALAEYVPVSPFEPSE